MDALGSLRDTVILLVNGVKLCDFEDADDVVCLLESVVHIQHPLDKFASVVVPFGMCFAPKK